MRKELIQMLERIKQEINEDAQHWTADERAEFYCALEVWSYERYEEALIDDETEMQNFED